MNPDKVLLRYLRHRPKITIRVEKDFVLIEGKNTALEMLGKVLIAQSKYDKDCGSQMSPKGAASKYFSKESTHGIYIHRLPCLNKKKP